MVHVSYGTRSVGRCLCPSYAVIRGSVVGTSSPFFRDVSVPLASLGGSCGTVYLQCAPLIFYRPFVGSIHPILQAQVELGAGRDLTLFSLPLEENFRIWVTMCSEHNRWQVSMT